MTGTLRPSSDIEVRRIYQPDGLEAGTGHRVLVDRLWPRGVRKAGAPIDEWLRDVAPSTDLRRWYGHEPARFEEFKARYLEEVASSPACAAAGRLVERARGGPVVLVTATRDVEHSGAVVLRDHLVRVVGRGDGGSEDDGGDPACWADRVCEACGRMIEGPHHCSAGSLGHA